MVRFFASAQSASANSSAHPFEGGTLVMAAAGTWDSGTMKLQFSPDGGTTWVDSSVSLTADGSGSVVLPRCHVRAAVTVTGTSSLQAWFGRVDG